MLQAEVIGSMALPATNSLDDCVSFSKTVTPYLPQLYDLPQNLVEVLKTNAAGGLTVLYASTNPFISGLALALFLGPVFIVAAEINGNYSQVDRFWSILPTVFIGNYTLFAHVVGLPTGRMDLVFAVSALWSTRLTYNYWRRGGYSIGSEDYRWVLIQRAIGMPLFHLLNVVFIGPYQCLLLFSVSMPVYVMLVYTKQTGAEVGSVDLILAGIMVSFILLTYVADQQQYGMFRLSKSSYGWIANHCTDYQTAKYAYKDNKKMPGNSPYTVADFERGFRTSGLFAYSRHPNFAFEQSIWVTLFWWGANLTADGQFYNWTGLGALLYLSLFQGSTWYTELITARKYPEYKEYQKQVGMFLPAGGRGYEPKKATATQKKLN